MEDDIRIVVADDNEIMRTMIVDTINDDPQLNVVGEATDGDMAIELIKEKKPDLVILDLVMPRADGMEVMEAISECEDYKGTKPQYIVISAAGREEIVSQALQTGASYFFMKPFNGDALIKRIKHMFGAAEQPVHGDVFTVGTETNSQNSIETMVINLLRGLGVPVKMVGYKYLRDAIMIAVKDTDALMSVTKNIYPEIADIHGTSSGNVERNIRYVIEATWNRQDDYKYGTEIGRLFKGTNKKPTNSEFILICSEWINYQLMNS